MSHWRLILLLLVSIFFVLSLMLYFNKSFVLNASESQLCSVASVANPPAQISRFLHQTRFANRSTAVAGAWETEYEVPQSHSLDSQLSKPMMLAFHQYIAKRDVECPNQIRPGRKFDGGYEICMLPGVAIKKGSCIVYSIGIRDDWSFDDDVAQNYECEVHSFDPSIGKEDHLRGPKHYFHNVGIWDKDTVNKQGWKLRTLTTILNELKHKDTVIDMLKMDTEGAEWPCLVEWLASGALKRFKQIAFEVHTPKLRSLKQEMTIEDHLRITWLFDEMKKQGFLKFHYNMNGCCGRFSDWSMLNENELPSRKLRVICCYELFFVNSNYLEK